MRRSLAAHAQFVGPESCIYYYKPRIILYISGKRFISCFVKRCCIGICAVLSTTYELSTDLKYSPRRVRFSVIDAKIGDEARLLTCSVKQHHLVFPAMPGSSSCFDNFCPIKSSKKCSSKILFEMQRQIAVFFYGCYWYKTFLTEGA